MEIWNNLFSYQPFTCWRTNDGFHSWPRCHMWGQRLSWLPYTWCPSLLFQGCLQESQFLLVGFSIASWLLQHLLSAACSTDGWNSPLLLPDSLFPLYNDSSLWSFTLTVDLKPNCSWGPRPLFNLQKLEFIILPGITVYHITCPDNSGLVAD